MSECSDSHGYSQMREPDRHVSEVDVLTGFSLHVRTICLCWMEKRPLVALCSHKNGNVTFGNVSDLFADYMLLLEATLASFATAHVG